jgi:ferritin-like metal-binding protein YciE
MDVERSIEHLLKLHARAEQRMDRTDRQIEAIQKILKTGMKLIVRIEATQARSDAKIDRLAEMWLKRPPNGNSKR